MTTIAGIGPTRAVQFGSNTDQELGKLLDKMIATVRVTGTPTSGRGGDKTVAVTFDGKPYTISIYMDKTFKATSENGQTEIKLIHDRSTWGNPKGVFFKGPAKQDKTLSSTVVAKAQQLVQKVLEQLPEQSGGGGFDL
jgi:hypothetical protein